jgi:D-alanyl-D-alanine dipeptidase
MGTQVNASPEESQGACYTSAQGISGKAIRNRGLLIDAMRTAGFVNYPTEWWHWSYGDRYWAYLLGKPAAIFGAVLSSR